MATHPACLPVLTAAGARYIAASTAVHHAVVATHRVRARALLPAAAVERAIPYTGIRVAAEKAFKQAQKLDPIHRDTRSCGESIQASTKT